MGSDHGVGGGTPKLFPPSSGLFLDIYYKLEGLISNPVELSFEGIVKCGLFIGAREVSKTSSGEKVGKRDEPLQELTLTGAMNNFKKMSQ